MNAPRPPEETAEAGTRLGTRIPTVGDLVETVGRSRTIPPERRSELFHAARQVCAEELRMVRTGFAPASLEELVARVVRLLPSELGGERYPGWSWDQDAPFPDEPLDDSVPAFSPDDPFGGPFEAVPAAARPESSAGPAAGPGAPADVGEEREEGEGEDEELDEISFAVRDETPAPPRGGRLAAFLLVVAIAGGVYFFAQTRRPSPRPSIPPSPEAAVETSPFSGSAPRPAEPKPSLAAPAAAAPGQATAATTAPPSPVAAVPESRGATMISSDWNGHPAAFMVHFSSYQKKENADRDAARLTKVEGRPMHVIGVNLGPAGHWYRVMLGEFPSREDADACRAELAAKGTPGMGLVYRVSAAPAAEAAALPAR